MNNQQSTINNQPSWQQDYEIAIDKIKNISLALLSSNKFDASEDFLSVIKELRYCYNKVVEPDDEIEGEDGIIGVY